MWRAHFQKLFRIGDLFLAEGTALAASLVELGCPPAKIRIQPIPIDPERFTFQPRQLAREQAPVIAMCASFREKKGHRYAIEAYDQLRRQGVKARLRIIGDGPLRQELQDQAMRQGTADIEWLGMQSHHECARLLRESHVFLHPSVRARNGDREGGAPTILLEAQASGMPVVATLHDDIPEVTVPGASALLVPERDSQALCTALGEVLGHPERWPAMGEAGRDHVLRRHDVRNQSEHLATLYDEARELARPDR
jgi:colanic acid/amylovoran biosynthesis glycosyltransferase